MWRQVTAFLRAVARGFEWAAANSDAAANLLLAGAKEENAMELDAALVRASQKELAAAYLDAVWCRDVILYLFGCGSCW